MNEHYDYASALIRFHGKAANMHGFRGNIGNLYSAMIAVAMRSNILSLETNFIFWHDITRIGKEEFYKALRWLHDNNFLNYEEGAGQIKGRVTLHVSQIEQVGSPTYKATDKATHKDTDMATDQDTDKATNSIPESLTRTHARGSSNKKNNINSLSPNKGEGGVGEEETGTGKVKDLITLEVLVNQLQKISPNTPYTEGFIDHFLNTYEVTSDKDPEQPLWKVLSRGIEKPVWVSRTLKSHWEQYGHRFKREELATGTHSSSPTNYKPPYIPGFDM